MATKPSTTSTTSTKPSAATKPATKPATSAATTAPHGTTTTSVVGTPAGQVAHLAYLATLPVPVALVAPLAAWPGWGKGVRVTVAGVAGTAYANRSNVDLRTTVGNAAALAAQVPGATVRGTGANYVRLPYTSTGTPQA